MKQGKSLTELWAELDRQNEAKRDFVADTRSVAVRPTMVKERDDDLQIKTAAEAALEMEINGEHFPVTQHAVRQIGDKLKIPAKYVDRLAADHPDMLAYNVNALFSREPKRQMLRTLDGGLRAFLSDRFRPLDNFDLCAAIIPHLKKFDAEIQSADVTPTKLYVKASIPGAEIELEPPPGMEMGKGHNFFMKKIQPGVQIGNSEVGKGRLFIQPAIFEKGCTNYAVFSDNSYFKVHLGAKLGGGSEADVWKYFKDDTKAVSDAAVWKQVNDLVEAALDGRIFNDIVEQLKSAQADTLEQGADIPKIIEVTGKKFGLNEAEKQGVLFNFIQRGELSRYGLHAAITRHAEDATDYDRASELEAVGGKIIELPKNQWTEIAKAA